MEVYTLIFVKIIKPPIEEKRQILMICQFFFLELESWNLALKYTLLLQILAPYPHSSTALNVTIDFFGYSENEARKFEI